MGKNGNLIYSVKEGETIEFDGPGSVKIKVIKKNKVVVLLNSEDGNKIKIKTKGKEA